MSVETSNKSSWRRSLTIGCFIALMPCVGCCGLNLVIFGPSKMRQDKENLVRAEALAATLETYRTANGQYPESLERLEQSGVAVPKTAGRDGDDEAFDYAIVDSGAGFTITFRDAPIMMMDDGAGRKQWSSQKREWDLLPP